MTKNLECNITLSEILTSSNKLSKYLNFLWSQAEPLGQTVISQSYEAVVTAWSAYALIAKDGLFLYYINRDDPTRVSWAFDQLGLEAAAVAMKETIKGFAPGMIESISPMYDIDWQQRLGWMYDHEEELTIDWQELETALKALGQSAPEGNGTVLEVHITKFITEHLDAFELTS